MKAFLKSHLHIITATLFLIALSCIWLFLNITFRDTIPDEESQVLQKADKCTLLSLVWAIGLPLHVTNGVPVSAPLPNYLAGCSILGRVQLSGQDAQRAIAVFEDAPAFSLLGRASCFDARHALQIVANGHTYDFVICFECGQMEIYKDQVEVKNVLISGSPYTLNSILTANHIPLAPMD